MIARIDGRALGYAQTGEGPLVLLVHAFPFDRTMWDETARGLAGVARVVSVDLPGFGESERHPPPSVDGFADDLAALLDHLGAPMAVVAGCSLGGYVALAFAARHPARLAGLALIDTRAGADNAVQRRARDDGLALLARDGAAAFVAPMPERLLAEEAPAAVRARAAEICARQPAAALADALLVLRERPDRTALLPRIACPTLVVVGGADRVTPLDEARAMAVRIPGAEMRVLDRAGHLPPLEAPARLASELRRFLADAL
jgi:pimeloyl-ACP methyl ester carboxylesterase